MNGSVQWMLSSKVYTLWNNGNYKKEMKGSKRQMEKKLA